MATKESSYETETGDTDSGTDTVRRDRDGVSGGSDRKDRGMLLPVRLTRNTLGLIGWR
jgi:hypothetical protein